MKLFTFITLVAFLISVNLFAQGGQDNKEMMTGSLTEFSDMDKAMMQAEAEPTVLFFHASWCPSCKSARKDFEQNTAQLEGINLLVVDYDTSKELQQKYGVTYQHTFVQIDKDGMELAKWNGGGTEELLNNIVKPAM